jgi:tetratricopeptide (TPR) repeat protein
MRKLSLAVLFALLPQVGFAGGSVQTDVFSDLAKACGEPKPGCWKSVGERLAQRAAPRSEREREDQVADIWMVATVASDVADFAESKRLYDRALAMAHGMAVHDEFAEAAIKIDAAKPYLLTRDYAVALRLLDEALSSSAAATESGEFSLLRAAALIGLQRNAEADHILQGVFDHLDFDGIMPFDGLPFGPQPVDPYDTGLRIAAHFGREGQYDKALTLLDTLDGKVLSAAGKPAEHGVFPRHWVDKASRVAILDGKAAIYLAQGRQALAETTLQQAIQIPEQDAEPNLRRALARLATVERQSGQLKSADQLEQRARAIRTEKYFVPDPLVGTLAAFD